jgi:hypothetical protein
MAIPKAESLQDKIESEVAKGDITSSVEKSHGVLKQPSQKTYNRVVVYNDYVAVLRLPRESIIALPGSTEYSNFGIIAGVGQRCVNSFNIGDAVMLNPKGGTITQLDIDGYEEGSLHLLLEKNVFCKVENSFDIEIR